MDNLPVAAMLKLSVLVIMFKHKIKGKDDLVAVDLIVDNVDGIDFVVLEYLDLPQEFKEKVLEK